MAQRIHGQERGEGKKWQAVFFPQFVKGKTVSLLPPLKDSVRHSSVNQIF